MLSVREKATYVAVMVVIAIIATTPLWFMKDVFFPSSTKREKQKPLWARVSYGILCALSLVVVGLWFWVIRIVCGYNDTTTLLDTTSFVAMIPCAIMLYGMLPAAIAYGIISSGNRKDNNNTRNI